MVADPFADVSEMINICTSSVAEQINFCKTGIRTAASTSAPVAGKITSLWRYDGAPGAASQTAPTTASVVTNATAGSFQQASPAAGTKKRLLGVSAVGIASGTLILYDRLVQGGGGAATATTKTWNTPSLTRHTSGVGVEAWLEQYALIGITARNLTMSYTNTVPTSGQTSPITSYGGTNNTALNAIDRIQPLTLAAGDIGVTSVQSTTFALSTGTAGDYGITLAYPIASIPLTVIGAGSLWSSFMLPGGAVDLGTDSDACLALAWFANTTTAPQIFGQAYFVEK